MGAVVPSSRVLARTMARQLDKEHADYVIELGAGTGVVTHALLNHGVTPDRLLVIEREPSLHALLEAHFSNVTVACADATHLGEVLAAHKIKRVYAIVSSLPLLSMPKTVRAAIEKHMAQLIGEDGLIVQFTYGPRSPISKETRSKYHLRGARVKTVLANVPPAHVWVYRKRT